MPSKAFIGCRMRGVLLGVLVGCTHHREINEARELVGKQVEVEVQDHHIDAKVTEGARGVELVLTTGGTFASSEVDRIVYTDRSRGALQGLLAGGLLGGLGGALVGYAAGDDDECDERVDDCLFNFTAHQKATILGVSFGIAGLVVGAVIGAIRGDRTIFDATSSRAAVRPFGPAGTLVGGTVAF